MVFWAVWLTIAAAGDGASQNKTTAEERDIPPVPDGDPPARVLHSPAPPPVMSEGPERVVLWDPGRACLGVQCKNGTNADDMLSDEAVELLKLMDGTLTPTTRLTTLEVVGTSVRGWPTAKVRAAPANKFTGIGQGELYLDLDPAQLIPQVDRTYRKNLTTDAWIELLPGVPWEASSNERGTYCEDGVCVSLTIPAANLAAWTAPTFRHRPTAPSRAELGMSASDEPYAFAFTEGMVVTTRPGGSTVIASHGDFTLGPSFSLPDLDFSGYAETGNGFVLRREGRFALVRLQTRHMQVQGWMEVSVLQPAPGDFAWSHVRAGLAGGLGSYINDKVSLDDLQVLSEGVVLRDPSSGQVRGRITRGSAFPWVRNGDQALQIPLHTDWGLFFVTVDRQDHTPPAVPYAARQRAHLASVGRMEHVDAGGACRAFSFEPETQWNGRLVPDDPTVPVHRIQWRYSREMLRSGAAVTSVSIQPGDVPHGIGDTIRKIGCDSRPCPLEGKGWRVTAWPCEPSASRTEPEMSWESTAPQSSSPRKAPGHPPSLRREIYRRSKPPQVHSAYLPTDRLQHHQERWLWPADASLCAGEACVRRPGTHTSPIQLLSSRRLPTDADDATWTIPGDVFHDRWWMGSVQVNLDGGLDGTLTQIKEETHLSPSPDGAAHIRLLPGLVVGSVGTRSKEGICDDHLCIYAAIPDDALSHRASPVSFGHSWSQVRIPYDGSLPTGSKVLLTYGTHLLARPDESDVLAALRPAEPDPAPLPDATQRTEAFTDGIPGWVVDTTATHALVLVRSSHAEVQGWVRRDDIRDPAQGEAASPTTRETTPGNRRVAMRDELAGRETMVLRPGGVLRDSPEGEVVGRATRPLLIHRDLIDATSAWVPVEVHTDVGVFELWVRKEALRPGS